MAIQFVNNVDFNANQAQSIRIENLATDPSTELVIGRIIFNTSADTLKQYVADAGSGNPGWVEVGSTTVKAGTGIGVTFTGGEATVRNTGLVTVTDGTYIDLTKQGGGDNTELTADLSAAGTADATKYLRGDNTWSAISGIYAWDIAGDTGGETIVNGDTVTFSGGTNITTAYDTNNKTLTVDLDDSVSLLGSLTVGTTGSFTGQVTVPTATAGTNAPNLAQVQSLIAGVGVFQGGYNAITNSPALTGGSNIALDQGDYFAVTDSDNTSFLGTILEVGDLIFANNDITASSTPSASDYTIVQSGQSIAGEGATDGATIKGIAGFNSAHFSVTTNGFVSADVATASTIGIGNVNSDANNNKLGVSVSYSSGTADVGLDINGLTEDTAPVDTDTVVIYDGSTSTNKKATLASIADAIDVSKGVNIDLDGSDAWVLRTESGGLTTFAVTVNNANVLPGAIGLDVKAEIISSAGQTVYADVTRTFTLLNVIFTGSVANGAYRALLVNVG